MRSFVRIYGPPLLKAIRALEKLAISTSEVCIMDPMIETAASQFNTQEGVMNYFAPVGGIPEKVQGAEGRSDQYTHRADR